MPIIDLQQRTRELGRIRLGQVVATKNGGTRPAKIDKFRLTSASRPLLEKVAALYGGEVREWIPANGGPSQWEVFTDVDRLPILVPPQPVSQWYELWSGGGCQRRCDGAREILKETPCLCAQADERLCKPTTRLNVVLRDVEGIGVFRLETHGYYAAVELPNVAGFLERAGGYVEAFLILEERIVRREGEKPKNFMVPAIEIEGVTPGQLVSGQVAQAVAAPQQRAALEAGPERDFIADIQDSTSREGVLEVWRAAKDARVPNGPVVEAAAKARVAELEAMASGTSIKPSTQPADPAKAHIKAALAATTVDQLTAALQRAQADGFAADLADESDDVAAAFVARRKLLADSGEVSAGPDTDALWAQIVAAWPGDRTDEIETAFAANFGGQTPGTATAAQLEKFLGEVKSGKVRPLGDKAGSGAPF